MSGFGTLSFLEHYEQYPCLWDKRHPDFKNRQRRDVAEEALLPVSGFSSVKELRAKIRSIRGTYNQEVSKMKASRMIGAGIDVYKPKLNWFSYADSFLKKNYEDEVDSKSNLNLSSSASGNNAPEPPQESTLAIEKPNEQQESTALSQEQNETLPKPGSSKIPSSASKRSFSKGVKYRRIDNSLDKAVAALKEVSGQCSLVNEFLIFGQHVAIQLSKLPLEEALILQEEIQRLLTHARLRSIRSSSSPSTVLTISTSSSSESARQEPPEINQIPSGSEEAKLLELSSAAPRSSALHYTNWSNDC